MIKFKDVFFSYENNTEETLKNINLNIEQGKWTTIIGKNGSGKSTLMKLIYGSIKASSGAIYLNDKKYSEELLEEIYKNIAVVFQNPDNQFVGSTVEEDIAFGLENKNTPRKEMEKIITEVLEKVDMSAYRRSEPASLSGGQKQRVAIASSLALNPKILILDEATTMLDPEARLTILNYIKKINKEQNLTIISISHDVEETIYADEIIILDEGKIVFKGDYKQLYENNKVLEQYFLERPFLEKIKSDLNIELGEEIFAVDDNEEEVINKLCKLILKM